MEDHGDSDRESLRLLGVIIEHITRAILYCPICYVFFIKIDV